jgi:hypothetical protein
MIVDDEDGVGLAHGRGQPATGAGAPAWR